MWGYFLYWQSVKKLRPVPLPVLLGRRLDLITIPDEVEASF